ncbi:MAG: universal stress protein [Chloroflexota bacterium]
MFDPKKANYQIALRDFQKARQQAAIQQILARLRGESTELLNYDDISQQLKVTGAPIERGLQEIDLDRIVGSVGRYEDFTRSFLPKKDGNQERWVGVKTAVSDMTGIPPIEVYQVGESYFVQDGNHRVSIARQLGSATISAYVTEVKTRVPLTPDDDPSELICKAFYADFLEETNLDSHFPDADLLMTFCNEYDIFLNQIEAEKAQLEQADKTLDDPALVETAIKKWYEESYLPVIHIIRDMGILHRFPKRTEADMFMVLSEKQNELEEALGWEVEMETAVTELLDSNEKPSLLSRFLKSISPHLNRGPKPGLWRQQQMARQRDNHLFEHMLIEINGREDGWLLLDELLEVAQYDKDHILGLHVIPKKALREQKRVQRIQQIFDEKCKAANLEGQLAIEVSGNPVKPLLDWAAFSDLMIVSCQRPPAYEALPRLDPNIRQLVQESPRPMIVVPTGGKLNFGRACLGYDGSPKSKEALFLATYNAIKWRTTLYVVTVETNRTSEKQLDEAKQYIESRGVKANYFLKDKSIGDSLLEVAEEQECTYFLIGGFSYQPLRHMMLGSTAERILRESQIPVLICR